MEIKRIAIDGPAGAGKSTMAKMIAAKLGIDYVDTGAMYRAIALKLLQCSVDYKDGAALAQLLENTDVDFTGGHILLDGKDVEHLIRTPEVSALASSSSAVPAIREKLVSLQRAIGQKKSLVMDGRDIGTNVLKDAEYKFYLTASARVRAERRAKELEEKGLAANINVGEIEEEMKKRDYQDTHRALNPLKKAEDAIEIDSSALSIDEVVEIMLSHII